MANKISTLVLALLSASLIDATADTNSTTEVQSGIYSLRNRESSLLLRPRDAGRADGNTMVLYPEYNWKCLKWDIASTEGEYTLRNLFTDKTFQPADSSPKAGSPVLQQTIDSAEKLQRWDILPSADGYVKIRLAGTELYLMPAVPNAEINTALVLSPWKDLPAQHWKMEAKEQQSDM
jgi:hypothetical protein